MSFSYTVFLALLLLAPGFAAWAGLRIGEKSSLIAQTPEKAGSTFTLAAVVFGALAGHIAMAALFWLQAAVCAQSHVCFAIDPNVYRTILLNGHSASAPSDFAIFSWFFALLLPVVLVGVSAYYLSGVPWLRRMRERATFVWLEPLVDIARDGKGFIVAYVVSTLEHDGARVAYEGVVVNLALDDKRAISMLVLRDCNRFLVKVSGGNVRRLEVRPAFIPLIQMEAKNFVNVALEIFQKA